MFSVLKGVPFDPRPDGVESSTWVGLQETL